MLSDKKESHALNILMLTQVLPYPPDSGGKIKAYHLIRYLHSQGHQVTLLSLIRGDADEAGVACLLPYCARIKTVVLKRSRLRDCLALARSQVTAVPFLILRDQIPEMSELTSRLLRDVRPDLVHVVQLNMAPYVQEVKGIPKVLDQENAVSTILKRVCQSERPGLKKLLAYWEWKRLVEYEGQVCRQFDHVLTVTEEDKKTLVQLTSGKGKISVVPIGVDCDVLHPIPRQDKATGILILGTMYWPPNVDGTLWFGKKVFPLIRQEQPDAILYVVGKDPPADVCRLEVNQHSTGLDHLPVVVTGYVEDPTPYFGASAVFVVPLHVGGGMRVKILDAWARGIPVVSTSIGAEGIDVRDGENILIADEPQAFAEAVVRVMQDRALAHRLADNGRSWVQEKYDWQVVYRQVNHVYAGLRPWCLTAKRSCE